MSIIIEQLINEEKIEAAKRMLKRGKCDCIPKPVWECQSGSCGRSGNCRYGGEHGGSGYIL